jgi:hypothetical protein
MSDAANRIVQKLWSYCHVLRDDGLSYQDYLEQLTFLLFLKMADERARLTGEEQPIPAGYRWADLAAPQMEGVELEQHYRETLRVLGLEGGMLGLAVVRADLGLGSRAGGGAQQADEADGRLRRPQIIGEALERVTTRSSSGWTGLKVACACTGALAALLPCLELRIRRRGRASC